MSDFVLNVVRRGAGLTPQTAVQPTARTMFEPALPSERETGMMEEAGSTLTPNATRPWHPSEPTRPIDRSLPDGDIDPQSQPNLMNESETAPVRTGDAPMAEVAVKPFAPVLPMRSTTGEPEYSRATPESSSEEAASPAPLINPQGQVEVDSVTAPVTPRPRQTPQRELDSAVGDVAAAPASDTFDRPEPRSEYPLLAHLAASEQTPRQTAAPAETSGAAASSRIEPAAPSPTAPVTITPAPIPSPVITIGVERGVDSTEQRPVHVRIGTIEVKATTPRAEKTESACQSPPPPRPQGFERYRRLRNYLN